MSSSCRLTAKGAALLIVDVQDKLLTKMDKGPLVVANAVRLIKAAKLLGIPTMATEQYPKGLGPTNPAVAELIPHRPEKTCFHCCAVPAVLETLFAHKITHVTLAGIEAHICIAQTALELLGQNFRVQIVADAVASRYEYDAEISLRRMERAGAVITTTEAALFEWVETADHPHFKEISALVTKFEPPVTLKPTDHSLVRN